MLGLLFAALYVAVQAFAAHLGASALASIPGPPPPDGRRAVSAASASCRPSARRGSAARCGSAPQLARTLLLALTVGFAIAQTCTETCTYASDGDCDDGGPGAAYSKCSLGTDCADCGPRTTAGGDNRPPPALRTPPSPASTLLCAETCIGNPEYASDDACDDGGPGAEYSGCAFGTDCSDCGPRMSPSPSPFKRAASVMLLPPPPPPPPPPPNTTPLPKVCHAADGLLECMARGCFGPCAYYFLTTFGAFSVIGMACYTLSQLLAPLGLPLVTICIAFGVSCGPYGFDLIQEVSSTDDH